MEIGFVHFDNEALRKAKEVMILLKEPEAVDELGFGQIRDAFSEKMFPGFSVLHNHAKYFLLLPALYTFLEREVPMRNAQESRAKVLEYEKRFTARLKDKNGKQKGVHGANTLNKSDGEDYIKNDPAQIYQTGLERYDLIPKVNLYKLLSERSNKNKNTPKKQKGHIETGDDSNDLAGHKQVFGPISWWKDYNFENREDKIPIELNKKEAEFLKKKIMENVRETLLYYILHNEKLGSKINREIKFEALEEVLKGNVPSDTFEIYLRARQFARFTRLLRLRYAMLYYKITEREDKSEEQENEFNSVLKEYREEFTQKEIEDIIQISGIGEEKPCAQFCRNAAKLIDKRNFEELDKLIEERENAIKGERSKLKNTNKKGEDKMNTDLLYFRWPEVRDILVEIKEGLGNER